MSLKPEGGLAVMQNRRDPIDSLDFFPTPPWATRALVECVLAPLGFSLGNADVWEPAAGGGHMSQVLAAPAGIPHVRKTRFLEHVAPLMLKRAAPR